MEYKTGKNSMTDWKVVGYAAGALMVALLQIYVPWKKFAGIYTYDISNVSGMLCVAIGIWMTAAIKNIEKKHMRLTIILYTCLMMGISACIYDGDIKAKMVWIGVWGIITSAMIMWSLKNVFAIGEDQAKKIKDNKDSVKVQMKDKEISTRQNIQKQRLEAKVSKVEKWKNGKEKRYDEKYGQKKNENKAYEIIALIISLALIACVILFPVMIMPNKQDNFFAGWMDSIKELSRYVNDNLAADAAGSDNVQNIENMTGLQLIAQYLILSIATLGCTITILLSLQRFIANMLIRLIGKFTSNTYWSSDGETEDFLKKYAVSICILVLTSSVLFAFVGKVNDELWTNSWYQLLIVIVIMMILVVTIEIIRLIIEQSVHKYSLLIHCIRYVYILVMNLTMSILIGVIRNINIPEILTELTGSENKKSKEVINKIEKNIYNALYEETKRFKKESKADKKQEELRPTIQRVR